MVPVPKVSMWTLTRVRRVTDGVGELHFALRGEAGGDDVLRDPAAHVGGAAVHLRRIFAGERATAVTAHAAVGIHDDLATGQAAVALRTADDELAGRVDEILGLLGEQAFFGRTFLMTFSMQNFSISACSTSAACCVEMTTLDDARGLAISYSTETCDFASGRSHLASFAGLADAGQLAAEAVGEHDRRGHQLGRFVAGVTEHHALVASALLRGLLALASRRPRLARCRGSGW
jgi:hypothetical protein